MRKTKTGLSGQYILSRIDISAASRQWRRPLWGTGARVPLDFGQFHFNPLWSKSESQLSKYFVVCEISWCRYQELIDQFISIASVTKLLVIEQLLHPALKSTMSAPWHNFHLCPSSQQILATPLQRNKQAFEENRRIIERLKGGGRLRSVRRGDSTERFEQLALVQEENYIIARFCISKFRQFHPLIQKSFYDNNLRDPPIKTDCAAIDTVRVMEILIALDKVLSPALVSKFLYRYKPHICLSYAAESYGAP